jgi:prepilin-type N-terminal cleavage/methylation domain-containing protein
MSFNFKKAFTLIELLVVIAIIGILSGLIVVSMNGVTSKATVAKAQVFSNSLRNSLMLNLVSEWKFDEGSGSTVSDAWGKTANGAITGATYSTSCVYNSCLTFSGSNQYITVDRAIAPVFTSKLTAMTWVKSSSLATQTAIAQFDINSQRSWEVGLSNGSLLAALSADGGSSNYKSYTSTAATLSNGSWHLIGFSFNAGTLSLYIDGETVAVTKGTDGTVNSLYDSTADLTMGCSLSSGSQVDLLTGSMDDTRLFSEAVPTSQIKELYYSGLNNLLAKGEISPQEYSQRVSTIGIIN